MIKPPKDEEAEAQARRQQAELRDMAWEHLRGSHDRYKEDSEAGHYDAAYSESRLALDWMAKFMELSGDRRQ